MVFEIDLTNITNICKLYNTPVDYAYFKRSLEERIRSNIDSTSARHTLAVLDEFGKEHIDRIFNSAYLYKKYLDSLTFDEDELKIYSTEMEGTPYEESDLSLRDLLLFIEFGTVRLGTPTIPIITNAIKEVEKDIDNQINLEKSKHSS